LDDPQAKFAQEISKARQSVKTGVQSRKKTFEDFLEAADYTVIEGTNCRTFKTLRLNFQFSRSFISR